MGGLMPHGWAGHGNKRIGWCPISRQRDADALDGLEEVADVGLLDGSVSCVGL